MNSFFTKWSSAPLTVNEKLMIINVYNYFSEVKSKKEDHQKVILYKHIIEVLGIGESTVRRIILDWRSCGDNTFTPHKMLRHSKSQLDEIILEFLYTKILNANKIIKLLFTYTLQQFLAEKRYNFSK